MTKGWVNRQRLTSRDFGRNKTNGLDNNPITVPPIEKKASARISLRELPD